MLYLEFSETSQNFSSFRQLFFTDSKVGPKDKNIKKYILSIFPLVPSWKLLRKVVKQSLNFVRFQTIINLAFAENFSCLSQKLQDALISGGVNISNLASPLFKEMHLVKIGQNWSRLVQTCRNLFLPGTLAVSFRSCNDLSK